MSWLDEVPWGTDGLIAAVAQDATSGRVLTVAWMNREALEQTAEKGEAVSCFFRKLDNGIWLTTDPVLKDPKTIYKK